jgi:hypothetical protein
MLPSGIYKLLKILDQTHTKTTKPSHPTMKKLLLLLPLSLTSCGGMGGSMDPQTAAALSASFIHASANPYFPPMAISDYQAPPEVPPINLPTYPPIILHPMHP